LYLPDLHLACGERAIFTLVWSDEIVCLVGPLEARPSFIARVATLLYFILTLQDSLKHHRRTDATCLMHSSSVHLGIADGLQKSSSAGWRPHSAPGVFAQTRPENIDFVGRDMRIWWCWEESAVCAASGQLGSNAPYDKASLPRRVSMSMARTHSPLCNRCLPITLWRRLRTEKHRRGQLMAMIRFLPFDPSRLMLVGHQSSCLGPKLHSQRLPRARAEVRKHAS